VRWRLLGSDEPIEKSGEDEIDQEEEIRGDTSYGGEKKCAAVSTSRKINISAKAVSSSRGKECGVEGYGGPNDRREKRSKWGNGKGWREGGEGAYRIEERSRLWGGVIIGHMLKKTVSLL